MTRLTPKQYAIALYELTRGLSHAEIDAVVKKFMKMVADRNQASLAERIILEYHRQALSHEGVIEGDLTTAKAVPDVERKEIELALGKMLKKTVHLNDRVDAQLIGGLVVSFPDLLIDASLRNQLSALKHSLSQ